jgi:xylulokinase
LVQREELTMSLLGIDVGTTGCKAVVFSETGDSLASAYSEYDVQRPGPGWAELDAADVWGKVKSTIASVCAGSGADPIQAIAVSSLGEAMVPVAATGEVLGTSIVATLDLRGSEYLPGLRRAVDDEWLYRVNGNTLGNNYSLTKLKWIQEHEPGLYERAHKFLLWGAFVSFMLGAEPRVDYSLANRTLLFDVDRGDWSEEILQGTGLDRAKLPDAVPSGTAIGTVSKRIAAELGLPANVRIIAGAHDQCANAVGCGVVEEGLAVYGMGTFTCITPVFGQRREPRVMMERGLNTEHHAVPQRYVCFIYNQGGSLVKWYRDTFAAAEHRQAQTMGQDIYADLMTEMPAGPSGIIVLPHFATTGPPSFISDSCGLIAGLRLDTPRGAILKGMIEGDAFYLKESVDSLPPTGIEIHEYRAAGGGSKSDAWIQVCADIFGRAFVRPTITEAGALGAAIIAGVGSGAFSSYREGVEAMVRLDQTFEPEVKQQELYADWFELYRRTWPATSTYVRSLASAQAHLTAR